MTENDRGHRVAAIPSTQHVRVEIGGRVVADSRRPVLVYETGLPVRYYLPPADVDLTLLEPTDTRTVCPYKGVAVHWTCRGGAGEQADAVWAYPEPLSELAAIAGYLSFYDSVADILVEGRAPSAPAV